MACNLNKNHILLFWIKTEYTKWFELWHWWSCGNKSELDYHFPPKFSVKTAIILSTEPRMARWIMTGLFFSSPSPLQQQQNKLRHQLKAKTMNADWPKKKRKGDRFFLQGKKQCFCCFSEENICVKYHVSIDSIYDNGGVFGHKTISEQS